MVLAALVAVLPMHLLIAVEKTKEERGKKALVVLTLTTAVERGRKK